MPCPQTPHSSCALGLCSVALWFQSQFLQLFFFFFPKSQLFMILLEELLEGLGARISSTQPCICWGGEANTVSLFISISCCRNWKKRGLSNTKVQILTYIFVLCVFFCVFLSTFALIKRRESHHRHNPVAAFLRSPGAAAAQTRSRARSPHVGPARVVPALRGLLCWCKLGCCSDHRLPSKAAGGGRGTRCCWPGRGVKVWQGTTP